MKILRSFAMASFFFVPAGLILTTPSTGRADEGFRVSYSSGPHDSRVVTVALGHLIGIHVGHDHAHRYKHRRPYVSHETSWHYSYRVPQWHHVHSQRRGHRVRYGHSVLVGDPHVQLTRKVFRVRPEHQHQLKKHHRRHPREHARKHRSWRHRD